MAKSTKTAEVLEVTILPERDLDTEIKNELVKANVTDAVIAALEEKYGKLKLSSVDDKEGYLEICEARKQVRKVGIVTEKICKKGREDAVAIQRKWIGKEKEILDRVAVTQDKLDAEIKLYEDEVARKEEEIRQQQENNYQERQRVIIKMGATYNNGSFELNGVSYDMDLLKTADKETWEEVMLPKYQREFEKLEVIRAAEEKKKEEDAAKLKAEQEELEKQKAELARQQDEIRKQMEEINKQKLDQERLVMEQQQKEANELREKQDAQNKARMQQVMGLGLTYSGQHKSFVYEDVNVAEVDIIAYSQPDWDKMIAEITPIIQERKDAAIKREQEKREKEIEDAKQEAIAKEQLKQKEIELENQRIAEEKRLREAQEAAMASDKEKWGKIITYYKNAPEFEITSPTYRSKVNSLKKLTEQILDL